MSPTFIIQVIFMEDPKPAIKPAKEEKPCACGGCGKCKDCPHKKK